MSSKKTLFMVEVAIFTALALVLDLLPAFKMPNGGSISFAMIPVFIVAFRWGLKGGLLSGLLWGLLQLAFGPSIFNLFQALIEYGFAFTVLGVAGIFAKPIQQTLKDGKLFKRFTYITLGVFIGSALRFLAHFYAGIVFWGSYAPEGQPVWLYSLIYNGSYMLPSFILSSIVVFFLFIKQPRTLLQSA
ncbi:energy-coupled thiamine transporter ThiT [Ornithinibacillus halotolerans]|uniref:Thiamine transporter n=1 Tax=Ornithinibacillus halotolerans TaxID=1274357 RepID=A0A916S8Y6_9BACI|nr:energy-coupled thiamine transporter ThiT [Ornithinibacillus halotolerans]GGA87504.1 thiamine transporter [Ornithinibacillus halotolerans]